MGYTAIIDYGVGNLKSVANALAYLGRESRIVSEAGELELADAVIREGARLVPDDFLCGVVQLENIASMSTFLSKGFVLAGVYAMGGEYDFGYFVRPSRAPLIANGSDEKTVPFRDMQGHRAALANGFAGVKIIKDGILYRKFK